MSCEVSHVACENSPLICEVLYVLHEMSYMLCEVFHPHFLRPQCALHVFTEML